MLSSWLNRFLLLLTILVLVGPGVSVGFCHDSGDSYSLKATHCAEHVAPAPACDSHGQPASDDFCHHGCCEKITSPDDSLLLGQVALPPVVPVLVALIPFPDSNELARPELSGRPLNESDPPGSFASHRSPVRLL